MEPLSVSPLSRKINMLISSGKKCRPHKLSRSLLAAHIHVAVGFRPAIKTRILMALLYSKKGSLCTMFTFLFAPRDGATAQCQISYGG